MKKGQLLFQFQTIEQDYLLKIQANLQRAIVELELAGAELERVKKLQKKNVESQAQLDVAVAKRDVAAANQAKAKAEVAMRKITLKEFSLYAPFDGIISQPFEVAPKNWTGG